MKPTTQLGPCAHNALGSPAAFPQPLSYPSLMALATVSAGVDLDYGLV